MTSPLGGAALPVKGCGALTLLRYGYGLSLAELATSTFRKHNVI